jgi:hypothetical protein
LRKRIGLKQIPDNAEPEKVVLELAVTCDAAGKRIDQESGRKNAAIKALAALQEKFGDLAKQIKLLTNKPPNILIPERKQFRFPTGKALVGSEFSEGLRSEQFVALAKEILKRNAAGADFVNVDTLEIIGHTDGVPFRGDGGHLDEKLPGFLVRLFLEERVAMKGLNPGRTTT